MADSLYHVLEEFYGDSIDETLLRNLNLNNLSRLCDLNKYLSIPFYYFWLINNYHISTSRFHFNHNNGNIDEISAVKNIHKADLSSDTDAIYLKDINLMLNYDAFKGHYLVTKHKIDCGGKILKEKSYEHVINEGISINYCLGCLKKVVKPIYYHCERCQVVSCAQQCHVYSRFHFYECSFIDFLYKLGPLYYLAYRIFVKYQTEDNRTFIRLIKKLKHHNNKISTFKLKENFIKSIILTSLYAVKMGKCIEDSISWLQINFYLLFMLVSTLPYYVHSISKIESQSHMSSIIVDERVIVGSGFYLYGSFINHSCNPNAIIIFKDNYFNLIATRDICEEEEITISYYFDYRRVSLKQRHKYLLEIYYFNCNCMECTNPTDISKFKTIVKCKHCGCLFNLKSVSNMQLYKCSKCHNELSIDYYLHSLRNLIDICNDEEKLSNDKLIKTINLFGNLVHQNNYDLSKLKYSLAKRYCQIELYDAALTEISDVICTIENFYGSYSYEYFQMLNIFITVLNSCINQTRGTNSLFILDNMKNKLMDQCSKLLLLCKIFEDQERYDENIKLIESYSNRRL